MLNRLEYLKRFRGKRLLASLGLAMIAASCAPVMSAREDDQPKRVTLKTHPPIQLAVEEAGAGEPILFIHGLGTSTYTWRHLIPEFARTNRVIAIDLKGFGASDKPDDEKYSVLDQAELVRTFIEQENLQNLTVVGHSFGGGVTLALALDMAERKSRRLKQIVLVDTISYNQTLPIFFQILTTPAIGAIGMHLIPPEVQITQALNLAYHDADAVPAASVAHYSQPLYAVEGKEALRKTVLQIIPPNIDEYTKRYKSIKLPTLIVWCEQDKIIPLSFGRRLALDIKGSALHVVKACGHLPQEEKPQETIRAIKNFMKRSS